MYLEERVAAIEEYLKAIDRKLDEALLQGVMDVRAIAEYCGVSPNSLYTTKRYLLPNFGEGVQEGKKKSWTRQEVLDWHARGIDRLQHEYELKKLDTKKRA